jgi:hypothetical protein
MMRSFFIATVASLVAGSLGAQDTFTSIASYSISIPAGDTRRFVNNPSWFGLNWEGAWTLTGSTSAGVAFGVQDFRDMSFGTTNFPSGAATGDQVRDLLIVTFMGTGRWFPFGVRLHRPYLGLGAGLAYGNETFELGLANTSRSALHLAIAPEGGWQFPLFDGVAMRLGVRYTFTTSNGGYIGGGSRSFPYGTFSVGILER